MNLAQKSQIESIREKIDSGLTQHCADMCAKNFYIFHLYNYLIYHCALNAMDILDDKGMLKHEVKREWNKAEKHWARYQHELKRNMEEGAWYLLQDMCVNAYNALERDFTILSFCCANYMLKHNHCNTQPLSWLVVSLKVASETRLAWNAYFNAYRSVGGIDLSVNYLFADMGDFATHTRNIIDIVSKGNTLLDFGDDEDCARAATVIENKIANNDFMEECARKAIKVSKKYGRLYDTLGNAQKT